MSNIVADHLVLLDHLRSILVAVGEAEQVPEESHALFLERFDELRASLPIDPIESQYLGQDLLCQIMQRYPQIAHLVPRDLLWFFAGDCLHYMPDEEIDLYRPWKSAVSKPSRTTSPSTGTRKSSCWRFLPRTASTDHCARRNQGPHGSPGGPFSWAPFSAGLSENSLASQLLQRAFRFARAVEGRLLGQALHQVVDENPQLGRQVTGR